MVTRPAAITDQRRFGKIVNRNATVSRSITIRSTKFAVICTTSCLNRDSSTSTTTSVSDSAPDSAGRRSSAMKKKLRMPQDSRKPMREPKSVSVLDHDGQRRQMRHRDRQQPPDADRGNAAGGNGEGGRTWIWRGRHGLDATLPGAMQKPWLATTRRRTTQPEPAPCHKNVVESS